MLQLHFDPHPVLNTERLILRKSDDRDIPALFFLRSDKGTMRYIPRPLAQTHEDIAKLLQMFSDITAAGDGITWTITLKDDPTLIGHIGFFRTAKEDHRSEIGYLLHPACHGKGIMQEAVKVVLDFGFNTMGFHSIIGVVAPENTASIKLLERNGFVREAYFREDTFWEGQYLDSAVYALIAPKK